MTGKFVAASALLVFLGALASSKAQVDNNQLLQQYTSAIEANPSSAEAWWVRGNTYWEKGDYDRALQDYNQAIELNPSYGLAYLGRGNTYLRQGNYEQALQDYNHIIEYLRISGERYQAFRE